MLREWLLVNSKKLLARSPITHKRSMEEKSQSGKAALEEIVGAGGNFGYKAAELPDETQASSAELPSDTPASSSELPNEIPVSSELLDNTPSSSDVPGDGSPNSKLPANSTSAEPSCDTPVTISKAATSSAAGIPSSGECTPCY